MLCDNRDAVRYGDRPGIDPSTGRQCRKVTEELLERLREYEKGKRPKRVDAANPLFFDLRTGEPIVWYRTNNDGVVELFDLMGFHAETGDELLPGHPRDRRSLGETDRREATAIRSASTSANTHRSIR